MDHFSIRLWCVMKSGFYTTASNDWLSGCTKKNFQITSQSQTWAKKWSWWLFGRLLLVWSTTAFWIPGKPLRLRSMLSKSMRCSKNCRACWWHWSIERAQSFSTVMLTAHHTTSASEVEQMGLQSFVSSAILTWPLASQRPLLQASPQLFVGKMLPQPVGEKKMLSKSLLNPEAQIFFFLSTFPFCFLKYLFIFNWLMIGLQYWFAFCHTSAWANHRCTYVPSLLNFPPASCPFPPL